MLQTDYVDLYLLHHAFPRNERINQWRALVEAQRLGLAKHIGVSNWSKEHLEEIQRVDPSLPLPCVNQIEIHPLCSQAPLVEYVATLNFAISLSFSLSFSFSVSFFLSHFYSHHHYRYLRSVNILPVAYSSLAPASTWRVDPGQHSSKDGSVKKHLDSVQGILDSYKQVS